MKNFSVETDSNALKEIARMTEEAESFSRAEGYHEVFSMKLKHHSEFKYSTLLLEPTQKTVDSLKGIRTN